MSAERRRTRPSSAVLWRVICGDNERWHERAREAFADALSWRMALGAAQLDEEAVEVSRVEVRRHISTLDALNRTHIVERSEPVPYEVWSRPPRARRAPKRSA